MWTTEEIERRRTFYEREGSRRNATITVPSATKSSARASKLDGFESNIGGLRIEFPSALRKWTKAGDEESHVKREENSRMKSAIHINRLSDDPILTMERQLLIQCIVPGRYENFYPPSSIFTDQSRATRNTNNGQCVQKIVGNRVGESVRISRNHFDEGSALLGNFHRTVPSFVKKKCRIQII